MDTQASVWTTGPGPGSTLTGLIAYFQELASQHKSIRDFVHGASADIISKSRSELNYPCLWFETPSLQLKENMGNAVFGDQVGAFVILKNAETANDQDRDQVWNDTQKIALQVLARIRKDTRERNFRLDYNSITLEPISTLFVDNDYGWRVEFRLTDFVEVCYNPNDWVNE
jgi:hypothetical protein